MLRQMEEAKAREDKLRQQQETRDQLDLSLKLKMKKKAKAEQEQLAFDLKILEQLLEESRNEAMEQMQRKVKISFSSVFSKSNKEQKISFFFKTLLIYIMRYRIIELCYLLLNIYGLQHCRIQIMSIFISMQ